MKTKIATVMFSLATAFGFSDETPINQPSATLPTDFKGTEKPVSKKSFGYVKLGVGDKDAMHTLETIPGLGLGYRFGLSNSAIDVSANYTSQVSGTKFNETYFGNLRGSYLRYVSNDFQPQSFYYGAGLAFGVLKNATSGFMGLIPSATVGYEMNRNQTFHSFVQLDVSQPAVSTHTAHANFFSVANLPGPLAEISVGLGF